ncbi:MAG TPA: hypothetical protein VL382_11485 [Terriglobales bacterium]|nr:hypothetical protein [Terriglobales bacterium]
MAVAMLFTAVFGFGRTYVLGLLFGYPSTITGRHLFGVVHLHALVFTGWLVLLIVQTSLIAAHRVKVHRTLGYFGAAWGALMIVVGIALAVNAARAGAAPPGADPYSFLAIPFGDLATFTIFFAAAVVWRNYKERHKRLMVLASAALMTAALARWPGILPLGPLVYYGLTLLFPIAGAIYDRVSRGRVHPAYWWGMAIMIVGVPVRIVLLGSPAWQHAMRSLLG